MDRVEYFVHDVVDADYLNVVKSFEVFSHRLNRHDRVEKATISVRRQFNLTSRMHHDFALKVQSWQHSLGKE